MSGLVVSPRDMRGRQPERALTYVILDYENCERRTIGGIIWKTLT
jgi:hypothetical protein